MQTQRFVIFFVLLLAACTPNFDPENVDFGNDPRILRGEWTGEAERAELKLLAFSPDGTQFLVTEDYEATLYDALSLEVATELELDEGEFVDAAQFSANGETLATTRRDTLFSKDDAYISLWDTQTGQRLQTISFKGELAGFSADLERFAILPFTEQTEQITVEIRSISGENQLSSFAIPERYGNFTLSPDLTTLAALRLNERRKDSDYTVTLWNLETQAIVLETTVDAKSLDYETFLFSSDSALLAVSHGQGEGGITDMWDVATGEILASFGEVAGEPLAFGSDKLVTRPSCSSCFYIWDARTLTKLAEVEIDLEFISSPLFGAQLSRIAARGPESQLLISDLTSGDILVSETVPAAEPLYIRLNLAATYVSRTSCGVSGTLQYGEETYTVQGNVEGAGEEVYLKPTRLPPEAYFNLEALDAGGEIDWVLKGSTPDSRTYANSPSLEDISLEGDIQRPATQSPSRSFYLERQP